MTTETVPPIAEQEKARYYGFSALLSGLAKMWRAALPALVMIVLNALVQASLVSQGAPVGWTAQFILPLIGSVIMFLLTGAVLASGAYEAAAGRASFGIVMARMRRNFSRFALWVILATVLATLGAMFNAVLGVIIGWALVYVPIAAVDDQGNPIVYNFKAIGRHPFRWIITGIIIGILLAIGFLVGAFNTFLIGGFVGSLAAMLVGGVFSWWYLTTWSCLYRSRAGDEGPAPAA